MRTYRTWSQEDEVRLEELTRAVEAELEAGQGERAASEAVPKWAGHETITELADRLGVQRSALSVCLSGRKEGAPKWNVRELLERELLLPPGGMTRILSMVEDYRERTG